MFNFDRKMVDVLACYNKIRKDVEQFIELAEENPNFFKYSKGTQILFSDLFYRPKFMFLGINPGAGYFNYHGKRVRKLGVQKQLEYSYKIYKYALAINTRKLFELANCTEYLKDSVKSNCFFFATTTEKELYQMLSHVKDLSVYKKSEEWSSELVSLVQPEILICEGKSAFDRFVKNKKCRVEKSGSVNIAYWNNIAIIGYLRIFSFIKDIELVAETIKKVLSNRKG